MSAPARRTRDTADHLGTADRDDALSGGAPEAPTRRGAARRAGARDTGARRAGARDTARRDGDRTIDADAPRAGDSAAGHADADAPPRTRRGRRSEEERAATRSRRRAGEPSRRRQASPDPADEGAPTGRTRSRRNADPAPRKRLRRDTEAGRSRRDEDFGAGTEARRSRGDEDFGAGTAVPPGRGTGARRSRGDEDFGAGTAVPPVRRSQRESGSGEPSTPVRRSHRSAVPEEATTEPADTADAGTGTRVRRVRDRRGDAGRGPRSGAAGRLDAPARPERGDRPGRAGGRARTATADRAQARRAQPERHATAQRADAVPEDAGAGRASFVVAIIALLVVGVAATLWLSTQAIADSYRLEKAKEGAALLSEQAAVLQRDVARQESAPELARRARELGMVPAGDSAWLVVDPDGTIRVVGEPTPVPAPPPAPVTPLADQAEPDAAQPDQAAGRDNAPPDGDGGGQP